MELAFYDALEVNDSAVSVQATLRRNIRCILRKYGYPSDLQEKAVQTVIDQAKLLANDLTSL